MEHPEMKNTVFGEVLCGLFEDRGLEVTPGTVGQLAEAAGQDGWAVINRMASLDAGSAGGLNGIAAVLDLSKAEMMELALAYTFEVREHHPASPRAAI
jgi:hypothetical protein